MGNLNHPQISHEKKNPFVPEKLAPNDED